MEKTTCKCDSCGTEFELKPQTCTDTMADGRDVVVMYFDCSYCGERFIVSVEDDIVRQWKSELHALQSEYMRSYGVEEDPHKLRNEMGFRKRKLFVYSSKLIKKYTKELRSHG